MMCQSYSTRIVVVLAFLGAVIWLGISFNSESSIKNDNSEIDEIIIQKYHVQSYDRAKYLKNDIDLSSFRGLYNILVPEVFCKNLIRIGSIFDGGKWICNPISMLEWSKNCTIYSLGISNDPSFEEDLQKLLNNKCTVRSVDKDDQKPDTLKRIQSTNGSFKKALIGSVKNESANIFIFSDILAEFDDTRIDILKIDIEGGEFEILEELFSIPICQILIEVHGTPEATLKLLQTLSKNGFYLFSYEINGALHDLCEYSFIHKSCFSLFNVKNIFGKYLS